MRDEEEAGGSRSCATAEPNSAPAPSQPSFIIPPVEPPSGIIGTGGGDDGESAVDGLDDGDAEPLVTGGIDEDIGKTVEGLEVGIGDAVEEMDTRRESGTVGGTEDAPGVGGGSADGDEMDIGGEIGQGLDGLEDVLAGLDGADGEDEPRGQGVAAADIGGGSG